MNTKQVTNIVLLAIIGVLALCNPQVKAQVVLHPGSIEIVGGNSIITDPSSSLNRVECARDPSFSLQGITLRFSLGFPQMELLRGPGRAEGSWTIRNIVHTNPEQVAAYLLDGKFNSSGQTMLSDGTFTLVGTANYQGMCTRGSPPPARPGPGTPVNITIQGSCNAPNVGGRAQPIDMTFEASDNAGVIVRGRFKAKVACRTSNSFAEVKNDYDRH